MCERHLSEEERAHEVTGPVAFVDEIVVALTNSRIYAETHPRLASAIDNLHEGLRRLLNTHPSPRIQIGTADGFIFFQARPLLGATMSAGRLIEVLGGINSGGLSFEAGTSREEIASFVALTARSLRDIEDHQVGNQALDKVGCRSIRFLPLYEEAAGGRGTWTDRVEDEIGEDIKPALHDLDTVIDTQVPTAIYQNVVGVLQDAMVSTCKGQTLDTAPALGFIENVLNQLSSDATALMRLARYEKYDEFTFGHSVRVCFIALNFARHLTNDRRLIERIGLAALMHDVGKAWVPFDVLHSKKRLSDEERHEMNMHPVHGGHILLEGKDADPIAVAAAFSHHQNPDGTGYPNAIRGGVASAATMIVKLADVYEALTAVRPYKPSMPPTRAYRIMMDMKGHFEPSLLRRFIQINGVYPVGSRVELTTGETARVVGLTDSLREPIVQTEKAASGEGLFKEDVEVLDLREQFGSNKIQVTSHLLDAEIAA